MATTPPAKGKRALEESGEKVETPAEKKARMKFEKLASSGPAFTAFKTTACNKVLDKLGLCSKAAENAKKKLEEARKSVREYLAPNSSEQDAVALEACEAALRCWEVDMPSPSDADREKALDDLKKALESVGPDVKLVKSDASLMPSVYFTCRAHGLKNLTDAKEVSDMQTTLIKTELATVDLFMKALLKISSDVQSYLKQKKTSQERADARKKRQQEADEAVKMREAAKNAAAKARMFSKLSHPIFGIKDSCWKPFVVHSGQGFDPAAHADEPWVMRASEAGSAQHLLSMDPNVPGMRGMMLPLLIGLPSRSSQDPSIQLSSNSTASGSSCTAMALPRSPSPRPSLPRLPPCPFSIGTKVLCNIGKYRTPSGRCGRQPKPQ